MKNSGRECVAIVAAAETELVVSLGWLRVVVSEPC